MCRFRCDLPRKGLVIGFRMIGSLQLGSPIQSSNTCTDVSFNTFNNINPEVLGPTHPAIGPVSKKLLSPWDGLGGVETGIENQPAALRTRNGCTLHPSLGSALSIIHPDAKPSQPAGPMSIVPHCCLCCLRHWGRSTLGLLGIIGCKSGSPGWGFRLHLQINLPVYDLSGSSPECWLVLFLGSGSGRN